MNALQISNQQIVITRPPESYQTSSHDAKASECDNFLLLCGVPVLVDILPKKQVVDFSLLSDSIFKLLQYSMPFTG